MSVQNIFIDVTSHLSQPFWFHIKVSIKIKLKKKKKKVSIVYLQKEILVDKDLGDVIVLIDSFCECISDPDARNGLDSDGYGEDFEGEVDVLGWRKLSEGHTGWRAEDKMAIGWLLQAELQIEGTFTIGSW